MNVINTITTTGCCGLQPSKQAKRVNEGMVRSAKRITRHSFFSMGIVMIDDE